ncbi:MAG: hypothetical protein WA655_06680 [Candidatus Korobacteraceae bacterium]
MRRSAVLLLASVAALLLSACGGGSSNSNNPPSTTSNRAFITNTFSGNLQIVDTQNDTTPMSAETTNSSGQVVPGTPVTIAISDSVTFAVESPNNATTLVYDPNTLVLYFVTNSTETTAGDAALPSATGMALFSTDSATVYVPIPNAPVSGSRAGTVEAINVASEAVTATYAIPSARYIALSPNGQYLLVFANNSDSVYLLNLQASTVSPVAIPGFAGPVNAFFSSDNNTAYVLNCGPECGSAGPASVAQLDIPSQTIKATVTVGGASVGLLNGTTLYVAGSPVPPGTTSTYDAVNVSNMTRMTANSVAIGDGFHTTMALNNNKLYIGANSCTNTTSGCLSVVDVSSNTADPPFPPKGAITALLSISNRNVMYVIQGGFVNIYDTTNDTLQPTQLSFTGALFGIVQVDP